jgi:hypothetical protein
MTITAEDPITPTTATTAEPPTTPEPPTPIDGRPRRSRRTPLSAVPRRTKVTVRHVGVASVLKFSLIFYLCLMLVLWLALLIIFLVLQSGGVMDTLAERLGELTGRQVGTKGYEPVDIDGTTLFTVLFFLGLAWTVVMAGINMFLAVIYNLISDIVGGVDVTLAEQRR